MNRARHELLPGAALAADQHGGAGHGRLADQLEDGNHPGVVSGEIAEGEFTGCRARRIRS